VIERLGLIVTDASPLITLGAARALSCLTMAGVPVFIPDMVYAEVTQDMARLGAEEVVQWVRAHLGQVEIVPTQVFAEYQALLSINPQTRSKGRGESSALEVLGYEIAVDEELHAVLLFEDNDIQARKFVRALPERVTALSTGDLLRELEAAGRIQSSDRILDEAAERGRNVERQRQPVAAEPARAVLREQLMRRDRPKDRR
jgi:predicted nucleic acid-binding protein